MKVTRIAFSHRLNPGKHAALAEQARRLGCVRSGVWQRCGSVAGAVLTDRQVRDRWLTEGTHGRRSGDKLHCTMCGVVYQADHAAAINVLRRHGDPDITLHTPHRVVKQIVQARADRHRTRLPVQDSSRARSAESETSDLLSNE